MGAAVKGGSEEFKQWRQQNVRLYWAIWGIEVVGISLPVLWVVGRRMRAQEIEHDKKALEVRGVGRLTGAALRGDEKATARLLKLLDAPEPVVRYQSARALVMVDQPEPNKELVRKVSYWPGNQKLAMVDVLREMKDPKARKLMKVLARDRSQFVSGRARAALAATSGKATGATDIVAKRKREARGGRRQGKGKEPG